MIVKKRMNDPDADSPAALLFNSSSTWVYTVELGYTYKLYRVHRKNLGPINVQC